MPSETTAPSASLPANSPPSFHLLAKPSGSTCNIDCTYCFFLSKEALYPNDKHRMSEATLDAYIRQLLESHRTPEVTVAWQGGEPTLMKLEFFEHAVELVEKYRRPGQAVQQTFQTNGLLLDDAWCAFFKKHNFLVGLSVDGPRELHDAYRRDRRGQGTFDLVMQRLALPARSRRRVQHPVHRQRRQPGPWPRDLSLLPRRVGREVDAVHPDRRARHRGNDRHRQSGLERSAGPRQAPALYADRQPGHRALGRRRAVRPLPDRHLRGMGAARRRPRFRPALRRDARGLFRAPSLCIHAPTCGYGPALEHNGDLYTCDHFVEPGQKLGNIHDDADGGARRLAADAQVRRTTSATRSPSSASAARCGFSAMGDVRRTGSRCPATASRATTIFARAWNCFSPTPARSCR